MKDFQYEAPVYRNYNPENDSPMFEYSRAPNFGPHPKNMSREELVQENLMLRDMVRREI